MTVSPKHSPMLTGNEACAPDGVPCAQCGATIAQPDWSEPGPGRVAFVWHCAHCSYSFSSVAFFRCDETRRAA